MIVVVWLCYVVEQIGTDIQDNKCGWLIVQALSRATDAQKEVLQTNYGRHDDECVARVKAVYKELNMEKVGCVALQRLPHPGGWNRQRAAAHSVSLVSYFNLLVSSTARLCRSSTTTRRHRTRRCEVESRR